MQLNSQAILVFEDGSAFYGQSYGVKGEAFGLGMAFTGMMGYQEMLTDPAHTGLIVVATTPHIGNTGWNDQDGAQITVQGLVLRDPSPRPSSWRSQTSLDDELIAHRIVAICGVDTRAIAVKLRDHPRIRIGISSLDFNEESLLAKVRAVPLPSSNDEEVSHA